MSEKSEKSQAYPEISPREFLEILGGDWFRTKSGATPFTLRIDKLNALAPRCSDKELTLVEALFAEHPEQLTIRHANRLLRYLEKVRSNRELIYTTLRMAITNEKVPQEAKATFLLYLLRNYPSRSMSQFGIRQWKALFPHLREMRPILYLRMLTYLDRREGEILIGELMQSANQTNKKDLQLLLSEWRRQAHTYDDNIRKWLERMHERYSNVPSAYGPVEESEYLFSRDSKALKNQLSDVSRESHNRLRLVTEYAQAS